MTQWRIGDAIRAHRAILSCPRALLKGVFLFPRKLARVKAEIVWNRRWKSLERSLALLVVRSFVRSGFVRDRREKKYPASV